MGSVTATLEFLSRNPLYDKETPYQIIPSSRTRIQDPLSLSNIKLITQEVQIHDATKKLDTFTLHSSGFQFVRHEPQNLEFTSQDTLEDYAKETEHFLSRIFNPVHCLVEYMWVLKELLREQDKEQYMKPGYRIRIIKYVDPAQISLTLLIDSYSTWRPLNSKVEDRPLAVCDYRSVNKNDLVAVDRVFPHERRQNYLLQHSESQMFYYFPQQTPQDLTLMVMFDTQASGNARCKP
ncbi:hypothetical protein N0V90_007259 [Kalmusia sp. IMI 367209]|nr:hypothetical protein N0V90_007259 [Kalmusia sp. IMI 367209]